MDPRSILTTFQMEHHHGDGSRGAMVEERLHPDVATDDPERSWGQGRIFRCKSCDEAVSIVMADPNEAPTER
jgi:hypothetical protein